MSKLIFRLRHVPEDEAEDIRELLTQYAIEHYETSAGNWGISMPGIWVQHDEDVDRARQLIDNYQTERGNEQRSAHAERLERGEQPTLIEAFRNRPIAFIGIAVFCLFVLYVMIKPFVTMMQ